MRLPRPRRLAAAIPTAPLANLVFLLLAYFVWTFTMDVDKATVALPETAIRVEVPERAAIVSITENGQMRVSDGTATAAVVSGPEDVLSFATGMIAIDAEKAFALKADREVPYKTVDRVIDVLKQARVRRIYLLTEQETAPGKGSVEEGRGRS